VALVPVVIRVLPFFHWYDKGPVPVAVTEKVAEEPAVTVIAVGCPVMLTGVFIDRVALALETLPNKLVTTTL
jgi:hypothetical protein